MAEGVLPVILARTDSRRLPGKVLRPMLRGESILHEVTCQIRDLSGRIEGLLPPVVATTDREIDAEIHRWAVRTSVEHTAGNLQPLIRLVQAAEAEDCEWVLRLNADSPIILDALVAHGVRLCQEAEHEVAYITNLRERTFPYGVSLEVFRVSALRAIGQATPAPHELEHVSPIVDRMSPGQIVSVVSDDLGLSRFVPTVRLTIDDEVDAQFFKDLWGDDEFFELPRAGIERVELAYEKRLANAT